MADEILSNGGDSGRGPSDDGSQSQSSITDESGYMVSPSHSLVRLHTPKHTVSSCNTTSSSEIYERSPFLMTFKNISTEQTPYGSSTDFGVDISDTSTADRGRKSEFHTGPRKGYPYGLGPVIHRSPNPVQLNNDGTRLRIDATHRNGFPNQIRDDRGAFVNPPHMQRDLRLCSEPPISRNEKGEISTALCTSNSTELPENGFIYRCSKIPSLNSPSKPLFLGNGHDSFRQANQKYENENSGTITQHGPIQTYQKSNIKSSIHSCPKLYKDAALFDPQTKASPLKLNGHRSKSFTDHTPVAFCVAGLQSQDLVNDNLDTEDDCNTTTTSGSYTIDHEDLSS